MSIRKRELKSGTRYYVDVLFPNGNRYRKTIGSSKRQAEQVHKRLESEIVEGKWTIRETDDVPFSTLLTEYLEYALASKAASTYNADKYRIKSHLLPYFGEISVKKITPQMVDDYKTKRVQDGAAPKTVNNELVNLSHMLKMAGRWGYVDRNVVSSVEKMRIVKNPSLFLKQDEIFRLLEAAKDYYIYPIIMTALHTGMRKSELFNLKWTDIDFDQRTIMVQSKPDWHTKNYKSRTLQITPSLYKALFEHRNQQAELRIESEYIFTYKGEQIRDSIKKSLRTVVRKAGIKNVTLHTLRHTFASQLVMAGVTLRDVQALMGHQSFETTLQYAHLSDEHVKRQVLRLPFAND